MLRRFHALYTPPFTASWAIAFSYNFIEGNKLSSISTRLSQTTTRPSDPKGKEVEAIWVEWRESHPTQDWAEIAQTTKDNSAYLFRDGMSFFLKTMTLAVLDRRSDQQCAAPRAIKRRRHDRQTRAV